jgi:hypothetical protein
MATIKHLLLANVFAWLALAQTQNSPNTLKLDDKAAMPRAFITNIGWMAGHWVGTGLGGVTEEIWSPPNGGSMMGVFRVMKDGKVMFYEICIFVEEKNSLVLKLKHFNGDLTGWEEKAVVREFPLVKITENAAYFSGITFRKNKDGSMESFVLVGRRDGTQGEEGFRYEPFDRAKGYPKP